ncbi:MAG: glycoside hydrolase, partial [Gammaproteobacteria bacterium]|nr:glycoside hydrolase [Gammaproteobacteria bacterium]
MSARERLNVVFCWHMHQPEYRDLVTGRYRQPWTYLHAIKDYTDMAAHLEAYPAIRAVVNFAPILLEGIDDYRMQLEAFLREQKPVSDPLLAALTGGSIPISIGDRRALAQKCLRANEDRIINRFEPYRRLVEVVRSSERQPPVLDYLNDQFFRDLLVWYHLAWLGESVRRTDARVRRLI